MSFHLEKMMRIVNDLVAFCYAEGGNEFQICFSHEGQGASSVSISCPLPDLTQEMIDTLTEELNLPRQHEIEQDYWELSGETELSGELTLVGMMIDEATVGYRDGVLHIHILRKN